ncbi:MAG: LOG family protein, partial [Planctomycetota bacterium]
REASFGLSIRLPFETTANTVIEGDPKLINFRYFFTRKLMFMSHADAVAIFPGGFGTQDETFETLTLVQTGRSNVVPVVLAEGAGGVYWKHWDTYIRKNLLEGGMISEEDPGIYHIADSVDDAVAHVLRFYRVYHSSRYVREQLVLRLQHRLTDEQMQCLNDEFGVMVASGCMKQCGPLEGEDDHLDLPRLAFHHTRRQFALLRALIHRINGFAGPDPPAAAKVGGAGDTGVA